MKSIILLYLMIVFSTGLSGQIKQAGDYGFRHLQWIYKGDPIDILVKSKKGDEYRTKP